MRSGRFTDAAVVRVERHRAVPPMPREVVRRRFHRQSSLHPQFEARTRALAWRGRTFQNARGAVHAAPAVLKDDGGAAIYA